MVKIRPRIKGKGKRWKKGQSSSSNPSSTKFRDAAKSRFFQENLGGPSLLTSEALQKHNAFIGTSKNVEKPMDEDFEDDGVSSVAASTFKTVDTFASDFSGCTNVSFSKLINDFNPDSAIQKEKLAILAAVAEVIKSNGGTENNTEYFGALMAMLENGEMEEMSVAAVLSLLAMGIKGVPQPVLQLRFSQCAKVFLAVLAKYSEAQNNIVFRGVLTCLSVLLRSQELSVWKDASTVKVFDSILVFTVHSKPKVRKAAQHAVCALLRASRVAVDKDSKNVQHPAASVAAEFCVHQIEKNGSLSSSATTTLHILGLLKDIMMTFPKKHLKIACETILKVMTLGNVMILSCGMQALHGLFVSRPPMSVLPSELNARLITALYDYQPQSTDAQPTQAWLAVMQEATINLAKLNLLLCMTNFPRLLVAAEALWLTAKREVVNAATLTIKACLEDCLTEAAGPDVVHIHQVQISKVIELLRAGLSYQYHGVWSHVLHLIGVLFKAIGGTCGQMLLPLLKELAELRDSYKFSFMNELDYCVGNAIRSMGPELVLTAIPLQINDNDSSYEFKRSWLIPVLRENIYSSTLKCFSEYFLPLAVKCRKKSEELNAKNDRVGSVSYDLLQSQIWALLPSFCSRPADISKSFPGMAKALGSVLGNRKDLRLTVMASLRKLILWATETSNSMDGKELGRFAKNYLPILFNIYTTPGKGSEEEGIRLAALETITVYLTISDSGTVAELFGKARAKLDSKDSDSFIKQSVLDLMRVLVPYQPVNSICELFDSSVARLSDTKDHKEQKKYYRLLEEICKCGTETCRSFLNERITQIQTLLLSSLSSSAPTSKGPRLRSLINLLENYPEVTEDLITQTVPEAVLSCSDINSRCRASAYELLVKMSNKMSENGKFPQFIEMVMAGLAGAPRVASATLLALASITYHNKELISAEILSVLLDNVYVLLSSSSREIVGSALSFVKLYITSFDQDIIAANLSKLMKALVGISDDCKRHSRLKTRDILSRMVRWFGADNILTMIPKSDEVMRSRIRNIRKIEDRKKKLRQQALEAKKNKSEDAEFSVKKGPKSIDDILAESDSDFDMDDEQPEPKNKNSKKKKSKAWIQEDADDILDFTVPSANKKITATNPLLRGEAVMNQGLIKKPKEKDGGFKLAPDGRLIIKDDDNDSEEESNRKRFNVPGLSDSDDYEDLDDDDDNKTVTDKKSRASTKLTGFNRKRKLSFNSDNTGAPPMKYQAGGSGIHRPVNSSGFKKEKKKSDAKKNFGTTGAEYRSKKAGGDIKRKGLPDPYAYLPLQKNMLNRRKKMKAAGQFRNIISHAKKGAKMGRINKRKSKR